MIFYAGYKQWQQDAAGITLAATRILPAFAKALRLASPTARNGIDPLRTRRGLTAH
jgi:hypothetical protein